MQRSVCKTNSNTRLIKMTTQTRKVCSCVALTRRLSLDTYHLKLKCIAGQSSWMILTFAVKLHNVAMSIYARNRTGKFIVALSSHTN